MLTRVVLRELREVARDGRPIKVLVPDGRGEAREGHLVPSTSGLSFEEQCRQEDLAWDESERLWNRLEQWEGSSDLRRIGEAYMVTIGAHLEASGNPAVFRRYRQQYGLEVELIASIQFRQILDVVFDRSYVDFSTGKLARLRPLDYLAAAVRPHRSALRSLPRPALEALNEPVDEWYSAVALSHYLCPDLALLGVTYPFWHPPPATGLGERYRQVATASGAARATEEAALKAKLDFQSHFGVTPHRAKPGPKPGSSQRAAAGRQEFEQYLLTRANRGLSPQVMVEDAELQRTYRRWKRDHTAVANENVIRHHLRNLLPKSD